MSREYKGERIVVYPSYIDKRLTRRLGRRVPREEAVDNPRLEEIYEAASDLGLDPLIEEDKAYPRTWYSRRGRVIVRKTDSKSRVLRSIAKRIKERRRSKH